MRDTETVQTACRTVATLVSIPMLMRVESQCPRPIFCTASRLLESMQ